MKQTLLAFAMLLVSASASAQLYIRADVGYNFPMNRDVIGLDHDTKYNGGLDFTHTYTNEYGSYGAGFSVSAAAGGSLSGILGYDLEARYLIGKEYTTKETFVYLNDNSTGLSTRSARSFQFAPALTVTAGTGKFQPFARMGPVVSFSSIRQKDNFNADYDGQKVNQLAEFKYTGGVSFGFKGVLGVTYSIAPKMQLYAEFDFVGLSYAPTKRTQTKLMENGQDNLSSVQKKEIDLEKEVSPGGDSATPPLRETYSMSSVGVQAGIKVLLR